MIRLTKPKQVNEDWVCIRCQGTGKVIMASMIDRSFVVACQACNKYKNLEPMEFRPNKEKEYTNYDDPTNPKGKKKVITGLYKGVWAIANEKRRLKKEIK